MIISEAFDSCMNWRHHSSTWQWLEEKIQIFLDNIEKNDNMLFNLPFCRSMIRKTKIDPEHNAFKRVFCSLRKSIECIFWGGRYASWSLSWICVRKSVRSSSKKSFCWFIIPSRPRFWTIQEKTCRIGSNLTAGLRTISLTNLQLFNPSLNGCQICHNALYSP